MPSNTNLKTEQKLNPVGIRSTIVYFAAFVALGLATSAIGPALPGLADHTGTRLGAIGFLFTGASFGYMLGSLGAGHLLDRTRGHILLSVILFALAGMLALVPLISRLWLLTAILFVLGIAEGGLDVSANIMLVWLHRQGVNPFLNALHFFFGIGAFLSPIIIAQSILLSKDINWGFWLLAVYPIPAAIWLLRIPSPESPHTRGAAGHNQTNWLLVGLLSLFLMFYVGAEIGFGGWIYTFALNQNLADAAGAAYLTSIFWGSLTAGRLLGIGIATRVRPVAILIIDLIFCLLSLGLIWLFPQTFGLVWAGTIALGLAMASIFPTLLAYAERYLTMSGQVTRWFFVGTGIGGMILPWALGVLIESNGPTAIMPALWVNMVFALITFLFCVALARNPVMNSNGESSPPEL